VEPDPKIAQCAPYVMDETAGKKAWCSCGESKTQPYCDGSHKAAGLFRPLKVELPEAKRVAWCGCKHTQTPPYCDGTHKKLG
jgi:CDGSH-type Zn-finger protein